ncbi:MAG: ATP-binding protein [Candidatus Acidiferrales bacterium]
MASLLEKLPTILILAVLVGTFISLRKHSPSERTRLWILAWALIFAHFFIQIFETRSGFIEQVFESIDLAALELSGVVFLVSLARSAEDKLRRHVLFAILAPAAALHAIGATFDWHNRWAIASALAVFFFGMAGFAFFAHKERSRFNLNLGALLIAVGAGVVVAQVRGDTDLGVNAILASTFGICGFLFWKRFARHSLGVITVSGGFLCWGAVFPVGALLAYLYPKLQVNPEIWNVPKYFVAFGMILSVLEEKSRIVEESGAREHEENALMVRFSRITSRLLGGADPSTLCKEIAEALTETGSFGSAAVILARDDGLLFLAGASGWSAEDTQAFERIAGQSTSRIVELCAAGERLGSNSFRLASQALSGKGGALLPEVIVPLISSRATCLGWIALSPAQGAQESITPEIARVEMLAADLAVTIENARLHHQLVRSEKLAALGQLVAGVAHELNNPLTGIIGYTELLSDEVTQEATSKKVAKLGNEARRMHRIVSGLLRFARQSNSEERAANFESALHDALQLREFHLRKFAIHVHMEIEPALPAVAISEDELKQILLNLLNNSIDALEESRERIIRIHAQRHSDRIVFAFEDSGPGFPDVNRAFDPFYTTKPVGKGTGLGLSICYGIVRECGGDIHLSNRKPYGAIVKIEIPAAAASRIVPAAL